MKWSWCNLKCYHGVFPEILTETTETAAGIIGIPIRNIIGPTKIQTKNPLNIM
jgi:hypothetical protein